MLLGYPFIPKDKTFGYEFDLVIVMSVRKDIFNSVVASGIAAEKIVFILLLMLLEFDFDAYMDLKSNPVTIISRNCWGGFTYHRLGLRFNSPFINMLIQEED